MRSQFNAPNALSLIRLLLIPVFVTLYLTADEHDPAQYRLSALVLLISGLTDVADGIIARKYHLITPLGKVLDPLADKLTQASVCICLTIRFPSYLFLLILFLSKELCMLCAGAFLFKKAQDKPLPSAKWFGKVNTFLFHVVTLSIIAFPELNPTAAVCMLSISALFTLFTFAMYIPEFFKFKKEICSKSTPPKPM